MGALLRLIRSAYRNLRARIRLHGQRFRTSVRMLISGLLIAPAASTFLAWLFGSEWLYAIGIAASAALIITAHLRHYFVALVAFAWDKTRDEAEAWMRDGIATVILVQFVVLNVAMLTGIFDASARQAIYLGLALAIIVLIKARQRAPAPATAGTDATPTLGFWQAVERLAVIEATIIVFGILLPTVGANIVEAGKEVLRIFEDPLLVLRPNTVIAWATIIVAAAQIIALLTLWAWVRKLLEDPGAAVQKNKSSVQLAAGLAFFLALFALIAPDARDLLLESKTLTWFVLAILLAAFGRRVFRFGGVLAYALFALLLLAQWAEHRGYIPTLPPDVPRLERTLPGLPFVGQVRAAAGMPPDTAPDTTVPTPAPSRIDTDTLDLIDDMSPAVKTSMEMKGVPYLTPTGRWELSLIIGRSDDPHKVVLWVGGQVVAVPPANWNGKWFEPGGAAGAPLAIDIEGRLNQTYDVSGKVRVKQ